MSLFSTDSEWARHSAIEQAMFSYFRLELDHPHAAFMADTGQVRASEPTKEGCGNDFTSIFDRKPLTEEQEFENQAWRTFLHASAAVLAQIHCIAAGGSNELKAHAQKSIAEIISRQWRSFKYLRYLIRDTELFEIVTVIVEERAEHDKSVAEMLEDSHA